jgi:hypothetical protein
MMFHDVTALSMNGQGDLFAGATGFGGSIYRSENNGDDWIEIVDGLTNSDVKAIETGEEGEFFHFVFAGTSGGAFFSESNGDDWIEINEGLTTLDVQSLKYLFYGPFMFAGTKGGGVFYYDFDLAVEEMDESNSSGLTVFPDPADSWITVHFSEKHLNEQQQEIVIMDSHGKVVMRQPITNSVSNQNMRVEVQLLPSGLYMLQLAGDNFMQASTRFVITH